MPAAPSPALEPPSGPSGPSGSIGPSDRETPGAFTDGQIRAAIAPLYAVSTGMSRAIANKPLVNRLTVLQTVLHAGTIRPSDIASALNLHQSQVTRQVQALEQEALVEVAHDPNDGRSWLITLTPAGDAEIQRLNAIGMRRWAQFLGDFEPSEVDELARLLTKLQNSITKTNTAPGPRGRA